jgi:hypothetical protein
MFSVAFLKKIQGFLCSLSWACSEIFTGPSLCLFDLPWMCAQLHNWALNFLLLEHITSAGGKSNY